MKGYEETFALDLTIHAVVEAQIVGSLWQL